jgi:hypothetical protein
LGDIGCPYEKSFEEFLNDCSEKWKNVFIIFGNREYYDYRMSCIESRFESKKPDNVYFLNNSIVYLDSNGDVHQDLRNIPYNVDKIKLIGTTLWSDSPHKSDEKNYTKINVNANDGKQVKLSFLYKKILFSINKKFILQEIDKDDTLCVLLTHNEINMELKGNVIACLNKESNCFKNYDSSKILEINF